MPDISMPDLSNISGLSEDMTNFFKDFRGEGGAMSWMKSRDFQVGTKLAEEGLTAKHPVILIPVSSLLDWLSFQITDNSLIHFRALSQRRLSLSL